MPKYKSKIERKIDALLTITDTLCTHIYPRATSITLPLPMLFNVLFSFYCYRGAIRFFLLLERKCPEKRNLVFGACATVLHDSYTPTPSHRIHELILFRCFVTPSKRCNIEVLLWYVCEGAVICAHVSYKTGKE